MAGAALSLAGRLLDRWKNADGPATALLGLRAHLLGRGVMLLCAVALIATLPNDIRQFAFADGRTFIHLLAGLAAALCVTTLVVVGNRRKSLPLSIAGIALLGLEGMSFVAARDFVRLAYLKEHFSLTDVPVHPQWGMLTIFLVSMVAGLAFLVVLTVKVTRRAITAKVS